MDAMDLIDGEHEPVGVPIYDQQARVGLDQRLPTGRRCTWCRDIFDSKQAAKGDANQEFAANIDQAQHDPLPSVRERMNQAALSYFLEGLGRQSQPFVAESKEH